jgi:hypothetical protein
MFNGCQMPHAFSVRVVLILVGNVFGFEFHPHSTAPVTVEVDGNAHYFSVAIS